MTRSREVRSLSRRARLRAGTVGLGALLGVLLGGDAHAGPHVFDLASTMPPHLAMMFSVSWFGIGPADPQGSAPDPEYGNWRFEAPACGLTNDPATCADLPGAGKQRSIASKRRPEAGIYSVSGRDDESRRHIDLFLSTLRRPCDDGARLDAWAVQLDSLKFTSLHPANKQSPTWDLAYRALATYYERADAAGLNGAIVAANDATVYWHFGDTYGVTTQAARIAALTDDIVDTVKLADAHPSATRIGGKLLLAFYVDAPLMTPTEWATALDDARTRSGKDFYTLGTTLKPAFFQAFDALAPWQNLGLWDAATGATLFDRAEAWQEKQLAELLGAVGSNPGRVVWGSATPGFDDYTQEWGTCTVREIPRDPQVLAGQMAVNDKHKLAGVVAETWDDWTEGHEFEPDVVEGPAKLVQLRQLLGVSHGDPVDPAGDDRLTARWKAFGQPRSCCFVDGSCGDAGAPAVDLSCRDAGAPDATTSDTRGHDVGADGAPGADAARDGASGLDGAAGPATDGGPTDDPFLTQNGSSGGCACTTATGSGGGAPSGALTAAALALAFAAVLRARSSR